LKLGISKLTKKEGRKEGRKEGKNKLFLGEITSSL
jgi:hypothetical protein